MSNPDRLSRRAFVVGTVAAAVSVAEGNAPQDPKPPRVDPEKITKGGNPDKGERRDK